MEWVVLFLSCFKCMSHDKQNKVSATQNGTLGREKGARTREIDREIARERFLEPHLWHCICTMTTQITKFFSRGAPFPTIDVQERMSRLLLQVFPAPVTGTASPCRLIGTPLDRSLALTGWSCTPSISLQNCCCKSLSTTFSKKYLGKWW